eukprot:GHVT01045957.1.p1 GENE.GHVT01045957.1~~GHVT01045957.1.p1  ORF type:complete len:247 (+),score=59.79 GHVT01045957.1:232-972(+)
MCHLDEGLEDFDVLPARVRIVLWSHLYDCEPDPDSHAVDILTKYSLKQLKHVLQISKAHALDASFTWADFPVPGSLVRGRALPAVAQRVDFKGYVPERLRPSLRAALRAHRPNASAETAAALAALESRGPPVSTAPLLTPAGKHAERPGAARLLPTQQDETIIPSLRLAPQTATAAQTASAPNHTRKSTRGSFDQRHSHSHSHGLTPRRRPTQATNQTAPEPSDKSTGKSKTNASLRALLRKAFFK